MRPPIYHVAIVFNLLLALCLVATCGGDQRVRTIKATLAAVNAARDTFIVFDEKAQLAIANNAPVDKASEALVKYRELRAHVVEVFTVAYRAIAIAATANDDASLAGMISAVKAIAEEYEAFTKRHAP